MSPIAHSGLVSVPGFNGGFDAFWAVWPRAKLALEDSPFQRPVKAPTRWRVGISEGERAVRSGRKWASADRSPGDRRVEVDGPLHIILVAGHTGELEGSG